MMRSFGRFTLICLGLLFIVLVLLHISVPVLGASTLSDPEELVADPDQPEREIVVDEVKYVTGGMILRRGLDIASCTLILLGLSLLIYSVICR